MTTLTYPPPNGCSAHESMAISSAVGQNCMPPDNDWAATTAATSAFDTHLFEAYVQGFCKLGLP